VSACGGAPPDIAWRGSEAILWVTEERRRHADHARRMKGWLIAPVKWLWVGAAVALRWTVDLAESLKERLGMKRCTENLPQGPNIRRLRAYAFDPMLDTSLDTAVINRLTIEIPWEDPLEQGPVGEYLEVVDVDPSNQMCYAPVDLNHPHLLAQDGLPPSEGTPQFHQQMVYAVAMSTIGHFEQALGRRVQWAARTYDAGGLEPSEFVRRLRVYPHALREANAYYSPAKKALLFGYFPASAADPGRNLPGGIVFTCLSHDVIAHETTHAILDGLHRLYVEPSNPDVLAFHEAFADIVALFQHFSFPEVLRDQIAETRGDLAQQNLLAKLAQQFGQAIGRRGALRDALGEFDRESGEWRPKAPNPEEIKTTYEPHRRGAILVAAVFDAFLTIYRSRIASLLRVATGGTGILPAGEIHPDLVGLLSKEAAKTSGHMLRVCIRALDYCPPVDINFGDYLRALITADRDMVPNDRLGYRIAFIEAFRRHGIYPLDVRSLSEESLLWRPPEPGDAEAFREAFRAERDLRKLVPDWGLLSDRKQAFRQSEDSGETLRRWLTDPPLAKAARALGIDLGDDAPPSVYRSNGRPELWVHTVRPAYRAGPTGEPKTDLVVLLTQQRRGYEKKKTQDGVDSGNVPPQAQEPDFIFRGGCTLIIDPEKGQIRYAVGKGITSVRRMESQRRFLGKPILPSLAMTYFGDPRRFFDRQVGRSYLAEPFALLHRSVGLEELP